MEGVKYGRTYISIRGHVHLGSNNPGSRWLRNDDTRRSRVLIDGRLSAKAAEWASQSICLAIQGYDEDQSRRRGWLRAIAATLWQRSRWPCKRSSGKSIWPRWTPRTAQENGPAQKYLNKIGSEHVEFTIKDAFYVIDSSKVEKLVKAKGKEDAKE